MPKVVGFWQNLGKLWLAKSIVLVIAMLATMIPLGVVSASAALEGSYFYIYNEYDLYDFAEYVKTCQDEPWEDDEGEWHYGIWNEDGEWIEDEWHEGEWHDAEYEYADFEIDLGDDEIMILCLP